MLFKEQSAFDLIELLKKGELSPSCLMADTIKNIEEAEPKIGAFLTVEKDEAMSAAKKMDGTISPEKLLSGLPVACKDNILVKGRKATCGSKILEGFRSIYNAHVIDNIINEQGIIVGNTNMDEFAMGSSTETSYYKTTHNPWDPERVPGGSSGGAAAAVASSQVHLALGSDTGGSIRQPAAFCGVVGFKPTYGLVSRFGLVAFASSLDQIGTLAGDVRDTALFLNVIAGHDKRDSTSCNIKKVNYLDALKGDIKGLKIGIPEEYFVEGMQDEVKENINESVKKLEELGAETMPVSLPNMEYAVAAYYVLATAEASSNLARYDGVKYGFRDTSRQDLIDMYRETRTKGFGAEVKRRILLGTFVLSSGYYDAYYKKAQKVRTLIAQDFKNVFEKVDLILTPTTPTTAFKIGEKTKNPLEMYLSDICTISVNLSGLPAISIPSGFDDKKLPIGLQLIGPAFSENCILNAAYAFEQNIFKIEKKS